MIQKKPKMIHAQDYYTAEEMCEIVSLLSSANLLTVIGDVPDLFTECLRAFMYAWSEISHSKEEVRYQWQMFYFINSDKANMFQILYCDPLEDMPLLINAPGVAGILARWRLKHAK